MSHYYLFDIETNGLLDELDRVHSTVIKSLPDDLLFSCHDHGAYRDNETGARILMKGCTDGYVIGHNIIKFDIPALQKVYPWFELDESKVIDTLVMSRLIWPDLGDRDVKLIKQKRLPPRLRGSHGLKAWGYRLGVLKGEFAEETDWSEWSEDMQSYCEQDVEVTQALWELIQSKEVSPRAIELEHKFAFIIAKQERHGYRFDVPGAVSLYAELSALRQQIDEEVKQYFPSWYINAGMFTPKADNRRFGYIAGAQFCKIKLQEFNPASRQQIADRLMVLYGWEPKEFTESGQAKVDETTLKDLPYPPAALLAKRFLIEKRIGQIAEGQAGWLKLERNGRIHGSVNTIGAVTGRCTHSAPNVAQVPGVRALYGEQCRRLFHVGPGFKQVGADASGLELRCLAHYMARYDGGAYADLLLTGDIHTANQEAAGLPTRDNAKTFIYAFLYGAGDEKIGDIVGKGAKAGKKLKENFLNRTPALKRLREDVIMAVKQRKYLLGIDGRKLHVRSEHAALNTLLQSAGALLVKQATINLYDELTRRGYVFGKEWAMVAHVHDEYQLEVREELAEEVAEVAVWSFQEAGRQFNWRCPLDGEAKIGTNWADCH